MRTNREKQFSWQYDSVCLRARPDKFLHLAGQFRTGEIDPCRRILSLRLVPACAITGFRAVVQRRHQRAGFLSPHVELGVKLIHLVGLLRGEIVLLA